MLSVDSLDLELRDSIDSSVAMDSVVAAESEAAPDSIVSGSKRKCRRQRHKTAIPACQ